MANCFHCGKSVHDDEIVYIDTDFDPFHPGCVAAYERKQDDFLRNVAPSEAATARWLLGDSGLKPSDVR